MDVKIFYWLDSVKISKAKKKKNIEQGSVNQ